MGDEVRPRLANVLTIVLAFTTLWTVGHPSDAQAKSACAKIKTACESAGFVRGGSKAGDGLIRDCIAPLMQGTSPRKATKPLPQVDAQVIAACRAENPNFGAGKGGGTEMETAAASTPPVQPQAPPTGSAKGPNIVFILADDFSMNLISSRDDILKSSMPNLAKMMEEGATFVHYYVTDSLCCPSRSSIFTGKLPHDTGVYTNNPPAGGYKGFVDHGNDAHTFALALHNVGYRTAMLGKYLNGYEPARDAIPVGWSEWDVDGSQGYREYNYPLNENGKVVQHSEYLTDQISSLGQAFIQNAASGSFFIELASFAPHAPYIPPARYINDYPSLMYDQSQPFGARPDTSAPEWLQQISPLAQKDMDNIEAAFRNRVRSDHAIDDMIGAIRAELSKLGVDKNTYIVFSSDNGYHMGEYSLRPGKMTPFDTDIHVPLIIAGPGITPGSTINEIVENIDLAPTFAELAGTSGPLEPDGHSLVGLLHQASAPLTEWRHEALIEHRHPGPEKSDPDLPEPSSGNPPSYEAIRTDSALYVEYDDTKNEIGFYDLKSDPLERHNIAASLPPETLKRWHEVLHANANCKGAAACWAAQRMTP